MLLCLDTDECASSSCNQWCTNTNGGYVCHCHQGYELQDANTCVGRFIKRDIVMHFVITCSLISKV